MQVELRDLQRRLGITAVFVTHDQEEALTMSDIVAVMRNGMIDQQGAPYEVYERPSTEFVAGFLGASNFIDGEIVDRQGPNAVVAVGPHRILQVADQHVAGRIRIGVRPERVTLCEPGQAGLPATITHVIYRGAMTLFHLDGPIGPLMAHVQNSAAGPVGPKVGDRVTCHWAAESGVILRTAP
jgi:putative spermidine/putrescine transport system ATP-binding protein/spermidine/putrescine transport system ATP-binding protein